MILFQTFQSASGWTTMRRMEGWSGCHFGYTNLLFMHPKNGCFSHCLAL